MDVEVGGWKTYFSYCNGLDLLEWDRHIYVATNNALQLLDLSDGVSRHTDIMNGLSDVGVSRIYAD